VASRKRDDRDFPPRVQDNLGFELFLAKAAPHPMSVYLSTNAAVFDPGGIAACSRWLSVVCDTTGRKSRSPDPGWGPSAWLAPHSGCGILHLLSGGIANYAQPPATSGDPFRDQRTGAFERK
jgi:hypothetical protein